MTKEELLDIKFIIEEPEVEIDSSLKKELRNKKLSISEGGFKIWGQKSITFKQEKEIKNNVK